MKRANDLADIENDAIALKDNAGEFLDNTRNLKKKMLCKKYTIIGSIVGAIIIIILIIVLPYVI